MSIHDGAKKIIQNLLETVVSEGDLTLKFFIRYDTLAEKLGLESVNYCRVCCQYLHQFNCINIIRNDDGDRLVELTAKGIDFLETM